MFFEKTVRGFFVAICVLFFLEVLSWLTASFPPCLIEYDHGDQTPHNDNHKDCPTFFAGMGIAGHRAAEFIRHDDNDKVIVAAFTVVPAFSTIGLWIATIGLQRSTNKLWESGERQIEITRSAAWRQIRAMAESNSAARQAAQAATESAIVAVGVELPKLVLYHLDFNIGSGDVAAHLRQPSLSVSVKNYGRTPAFLIGQAAEIKIYAALPETPEYECAFNVPPETVVESRLIYELTMAPLRFFSEEDIKAVMAGNRRLWVYGYVHYRDFLGRNHMARFCKVFLPPSPPFGTYHFIDDETHGYIESF